VRAALYLVARLTAHFARRYRLNESQQEELYSAGCEALTKAAPRYDPSWGTPFENFAWKRITGAMKRALARESELYAAASAQMLEQMEQLIDTGNPFLDSDEDVVAAIAGHLGDATAGLFVFLLGPMRSAATEEAIVQRETYADALRWLEKGLTMLAPGEAELIEMRYWQQRSWPAVAGAIGVSESTAKRRDAEVLAKLKNHLVTHGIRDAPALEGRPECA
jgi:RNA polymerase sigma factor (sigma-70 family)